ncbi:hypothetical protein F4141_13860 [Candidatus Poribacteria bacterium]|nr:hypothetical protein [Candidatus Poribacteria bacterium]
MCFTLNPIHRRACGLLIAGALVLLAIVGMVSFPLSSPPIPEPSSVTETPNAPPRLGKQPDILSRARFQSSNFPPAQSDFYRTIIDNNLFRPLGWRPPRRVEPYRLLGTRLPTDKNTPTQAILQSTATNKTHIVTTGDKLDAATEVVEIQPKQIRLKTAGQLKTLRLKSGFLQ